MSIHTILWIVIAAVFFLFLILDIAFAKKFKERKRRREERNRPLTPEEIEALQYRNFGPPGSPRPDWAPKPKV